jgi:hypothetical protein
VGGSGGDGNVGSVRCSSLGGEVCLSHADTPAVATSGACGTLASHSLVSVDTDALSGLGVAGSLVGALYGRVGLVGSSGGGDPGVSLGAGAQGAIVFGPGGVAVGAGVASALVWGRGRGRGRVAEGEHGMRQIPVRVGSDKKGLELEHIMPSRR